MIARFRVLLPFSIDLSSNITLPPFREEFEGTEMVVYPPYQAKLTIDQYPDLAINELFSRIKPSEIVLANDDLLINSFPSFRTNALQFDFLKKEFDRNPLKEVNLQGKPHLIGTGDPSRQFLLAATNTIIERYRAVSKVASAKSIDSNNYVSVLEYLNDDGSDLETQPPLIKRIVLGPFQLSTNTLSAEMWKQIQKLPPDYEIPIWENLLLDARAILPDLGASVVLVVAALETYVSEALNCLATAKGINDEFWKWLNVRDKDHRKQPSTTEQFDQVLKFLAGKSLKESGELWECFVRIKKARNSYVHRGKLEIDGKAVTLKECKEFIKSGFQIIEYIDCFLPVKSNRVIQTEQLTATFRKKLLNNSLVQKEGELRVFAETDPNPAIKSKSTI